MKELTFEITNYCPHHCKFCSSNVTDNYSKAIFLNPYFQKAMPFNQRLIITAISLTIWIFVIIFWEKKTFDYQFPEK